MKVVGIVGSPSVDGKTGALVSLVLDGARACGAETDLVSLGDYAIEPADGTRAEDRTGDTRSVLERIEQGQGFVLGTPVYRAAYSGTLKNLLDLVPRGTYDGVARPFEAKPVGVVATGVSAHHFLALEPLIAMLTSFFASYVVPPGLYAARGDYGEDGSVRDGDVRARAAWLGTAIVSLGNAVGQSEALRRAEPQV